MALLLQWPWLDSLAQKLPYAAGAAATWLKKIYILHEKKWELNAVSSEMREGVEGDKNK